jgi:hypothetical protein
MAPEPSHAGPIPRAVPLDPTTPLPAVVLHSSVDNPGTVPTTIFSGRSLTGEPRRQLARVPVPAPPMPMPFATTPSPTVQSVPGPSVPHIVDQPAVGASSPEKGTIPILHVQQRAGPLSVNTQSSSSQAARMAPLPPLPPTPGSGRSTGSRGGDDDDGFTPVTPDTVSPMTRALRVPRDALGIPVGWVLARARSRRAEVVNPARRGGGGGDDDEWEDITPLTPATPRRAGDLEKQAAGGRHHGGAEARKTMRQTLFGLVDGWWDLGLLDRSKSMKRRG